MQSVVTPYIIDYRSHDKPKAAQIFVSRVFTIILIASMLLSILINIFAEKFIAIIAPGFSSSPNQIAITARYLKFINPTIILIALSSMYFSITAAHKRLTLISMYGIIVNTILIAFVLIGKNVNSLVFGHTIVCFVQLLYCRYCAKHYNCEMPSITTPRITKKMRTMFKNTAPAMVGTSIIQLNIFLSSILASYLPSKSITYISYCEKIIQVPISMIGTTLAMIILPQIAGKKKNTTEEENHLSDIIPFTLRLSLPITALIFFFSYTAIDLLGGNASKISNADKLITSQLLSFISITLPLAIISKVMSSICLARKNTLTPMIASIITVATNLIMCVSFLCTNRFTLKTLMISLITSTAANVATYLVRLRRLNIFNSPHTRKICLSFVIMVCLLYWLTYGNIWVSSVRNTILLGSLCTLVYLSVLVLLRDNFTVCLVRSVLVRVGLCKRQ